MSSQGSQSEQVALPREGFGAAMLIDALPDAVAWIATDGGSGWNRAAAELTSGAGPERDWERRIAARTEPTGNPGEAGIYRSLDIPLRLFRCVRRTLACGTQLEIWHDVTDEVRLVRRLSQQDARLEQVERYKLELTANVTHDLRTPLASIKASISGLLAGDVSYDPAAIRETLVLVEEETDRLQRRVSNLLSMAQMEAGGAPRLDWVDIRDVVSAAVESLRSIRGNRVIQLDLPPDLPLIRADYDQLEIAIRNLVENAFNYSPVELPVQISAAVGMGVVHLRVRDFGGGLMPDEFERVFDKFYRGRSARRIPGTGIGLPICRVIAEAHGGRIWAEHVPGGGVQFVLSLPLPDEAPTGPESREMPQTEFPSRLGRSRG